MKHEQVIEDAKIIVEVMRLHGKVGAQAKFKEIIKTRKLLGWEGLVLRDKVQELMKEENLWTPEPRKQNDF